MPSNTDIRILASKWEDYVDEPTVFDGLVFANDKGMEDLIRSTPEIQDMIARHKQQGKPTFAVGDAVRAIADLDIMKDIALATIKSSKQRAATELVFHARQDGLQQLKENNPYPELIRLGSLIVDTVLSDDTDWSLVQNTNTKMASLLQQLDKATPGIVPYQDLSFYPPPVANSISLRDEQGKLPLQILCWKTSRDNLQAFQHRDTMTEKDFHSIIGDKCIVDENVITGLSEWG
ncbi:hypothetical protein B0I35DRAFT_484634 [Stachybotrys elegans]|uniref:Uncharacterized protein n=1 Tax=Stachybotrys elegans TaxID=80388 RepID=A0A8K0SHP4_9HYPO|nr:hypothetical protein B0I35DRAFT_484634 [Stachybotrys elegans]